MRPGTSIGQFRPWCWGGRIPPISPRPRRQLCLEALGFAVLDPRAPDDGVQDAQRRRWGGLGAFPYTSRTAYPWRLFLLLYDATMATKILEEHSRSKCMFDDGSSEFVALCRAVVADRFCGIPRVADSRLPPSSRGASTWTSLGATPSLCASSGAPSHWLSGSTKSHGAHMSQTLSGRPRRSPTTPTAQATQVKPSGGAQAALGERFAISSLGDGGPIGRSWGRGTGHWAPRRCRCTRRKGRPEPCMLAWVCQHSAKRHAWSGDGRGGRPSPCIAPSHDRC